MVKEIENIKLLVMEIIGYANGVMVDKVDTKMHRYFNEKASEVNNKIDKALEELQPLERISEGTKIKKQLEKGLKEIIPNTTIAESSDKINYPTYEVEPLQNGERDIKGIYRKLHKERYDTSDRYDKEGNDMWGEEYATNDKTKAKIYNEGVKDALYEAVDLLSQSKKEYIEKIESWLDSKGMGTIFTYDQLKKKLESLTNQTVL